MIGSKKNSFFSCGQPRPVLHVNLLGFYPPHRRLIEQTFTVYSVESPNPPPRRLRALARARALPFGGRVRRNDYRHSSGPQCPEIHEAPSPQELRSAQHRCGLTVRKAFRKGESTPQPAAAQEDRGGSQSPLGRWMVVPDLADATELSLLAL